MPALNCTSPLTQTQETFDHGRLLSLTDIMKLSIDYNLDAAVTLLFSARLVQTRPLPWHLELFSQFRVANINMLIAPYQHATPIQ